MTVSAACSDCVNVLTMSGVLDPLQWSGKPEGYTTHLSPILSQSPHLGQVTRKVLTKALNLV